ncbi:uncharacterized protein A4U43_C04F680 [Asparagus officinalis]|uniref:Uncharacterized protein n=1 Tax=Asparagus officinalis TaxID=4686 RepID=A0A5P1EXB7_ASPOF|nr:uncharacterized protein A4U43_C04F680 [Asparagus officinalis]
MEIRRVDEEDDERAGAGGGEHLRGDGAVEVEVREEGLRGAESSERKVALEVEVRKDLYWFWSPKSYKGRSSEEKQKAHCFTLADAEIAHLDIVLSPQDFGLLYFIFGTASDGPSLLPTGAFIPVNMPTSDKITRKKVS